jgi:hypothetical protein
MTGNDISAMNSASTRIEINLIQPFFPLNIQITSSENNLQPPDAARFS